jgi:hypothetical protein
VRTIAKRDGATVAEALASVYAVDDVTIERRLAATSEKRERDEDPSIVPFYLLRPESNVDVLMHKNDASVGVVDEVTLYTAVLLSRRRCGKRAKKV